MLSCHHFCRFDPVKKGEGGNVDSHNSGTKYIPNFRRNRNHAALAKEIEITALPHLYPARRRVSESFGRKAVERARAAYELACRVRLGESISKNLALNDVPWCVIGQFGYTHQSSAGA